VILGVIMSMAAALTPISVAWQQGAVAKPFNETT
jgi:hypothetical protein